MQERVVVEQGQGTVAARLGGDRGGWQWDSGCLCHVGSG